MSLNEQYQVELELNKLYKVNRRHVETGESEQIQISLFINSGSVDVYGYNGDTDPTLLDLSDMVLNNENIDVSGYEPFYGIPTYIAIVQNQGTTTELISSGLAVEYIKDIS